MTGLPALTLWQPRASLVADRVKLWETRGWPTKYRGRLLIHAAQRRPRPGDGPGPWSMNYRASMYPGRAPIGYLCNPGENRSLELPLGAIVASAELVACVPVCAESGDADDLFYLTIDGKALYRQQVIGDPSNPRNVISTDLTDQLPLGIWEPGRWGWQLEDIAPTTERCPWCWGSGADPASVAMVHGDLGEPMVQEIVAEARRRLAPCPVCDTAGKCEPIPAKGRQGLWRWQP